MGFKKITVLLIVVISLGLYVGLSAITADTAVAAKPVVTVNGGGTATFDFIPGLESKFAIGGHLRADGTATGHWNCVISGGEVTISGTIMDGWKNADGSVTFTGLALVVLPGEGVDTRTEEFTVTLWEGGPGVGRFLYDDTVVPDPGDFETVKTGQIKIKGN